MEKPVECKVLMAGTITVQTDNDEYTDFHDAILITTPDKDAIRAISPLIYKQVYIVDVEEGVPDLF